MFGTIYTCIVTLNKVHDLFSWENHDFYIAGFGKKYSTYEIDYPKYEIYIFSSLHMLNINLVLHTGQKLLSLVWGPF